MKKTRVLLFLLLLGVLASGGVLWTATNLLIFPPRDAPPPEFTATDRVDFSAVNPEGSKLFARWFPGQPGKGAVLLCHGHGVEHRNLQAVSVFLRRAGCSLLMLDFRAHGRSEGVFTSVGLKEWEDIQAVLTEAASRSLLVATMPLVAYGRSMGAATLANGSGHLPRIDAFILESCFADLRHIAARDFTRMTGIPDSALTDAAFRFGRWRTGYDYPANRPVEAISGVASRPLLLIHDGKDVRAITADFDRLRAAVPQARTLVVPEAGHVQAFKTDPVLFEQTFLGFLASAGVLP